MGCRHGIRWIVTTEDLRKVWCYIPGGGVGWMYAPALPHIIRYTHLRIARTVALQHGGIVRHIQISSAQSGKTN